MPDLCLRDLKQGRRPADLTRSSHSIPFPVSAKLLQTLHALAKRENEETPVLFRQLGRLWVQSRSAGVQQAVGPKALISHRV